MEPSLIFSVFTDNLERENVRAFSNANPGTCFSEGIMIFSNMFSYFLFIFLVTKKWVFAGDSNLVLFAHISNFGSSIGPQIYKV